MGILIGFLTVILVFNCLLLILLVLIQLPKKDAGVGVAFGGGATDALFGAGSGTALTKLTKYAAAFFMGMSLLLAVMNSHRATATQRTIDEELRRREATAIPVNTNPSASAGSEIPALQLTSTEVAASNAVAVPASPTNTPVEAEQ